MSLFQLLRLTVRLRSPEVECKVEKSCQSLLLALMVLGGVMSVTAQSNSQVKGLYESGDLNQAIAAAQSALSNNEHRYGTFSKEVAISLVNLSVLRKSTGDFEEALQLNSRAIDILRRVAEDSPDLASALANQGDILGTLGRLDAAQVSIQEALRIRLDLLGPEHPAVADTYVSLGKILAEDGQLDSAMNCYNRALRIYQDAFGPNDIRLARALCGLAQASKKLNNSKAWAYYNSGCKHVVQGILSECIPNSPNPLCKESSTLLKESDTP